MSKEYIEWLGPTPGDEDCAQCGVDPDFDSKNIAECKRFKELLLKAYPPPYGAWVNVKAEHHDFGTYREVVLVQDCCVSDEDQEIINQWVEKISIILQPGLNWKHWQIQFKKLEE